MRCRGRVLATSTLLMLALAGAAVADLPLVFHMFRQDYCPRGAPTLTPHNPTARIVQVVPNDDFAELPSVGFFVEYSTDEQDTAATGKIIAKVKVQRVGGGVEKLGKISARQGADGSLLKIKSKAISLREGDQVIWSLRFQNFAPVIDCFLLEGGIVNPEQI